MQTISLSSMKVGDLVAEDYRRAAIFKKNGIDFCCGGGKTLHEACKQKGVDESVLVADIQQLDNRPTGQPAHDFMSWSPAFLADYIVEVHHRYVRDKMPVILEFAQKVARVHGHAAPETIRIHQWLTVLADELNDHLGKEERILFPYIKLLWSYAQENGTPEPPSFGHLQNPIHVMLNEHESAGEILREVRSLSQDFQPPDWACKTYKVMYQMLEEFESDLHQHIHLENNILFPKALEVEKSVMPPAGKS